MVAQTCEKKANFAEAVEFYIMAGMKEQAFVIAQSHEEMQTYSTFIGDISIEERLKIAAYFEGKSDWLKAAFHYELASNPTKALKLYF